MLGRELQVISETPPERVRDIEAFVNKRIADVAASTKAGDVQGVIILAMMNLAEAHLALCNKQERTEKQTAEKIASLIREIDAHQKL